MSSGRSGRVLGREAEATWGHLLQAMGTCQECVPARCPCCTLRALKSKWGSPFFTQGLCFSLCFSLTSMVGTSLCGLNTLLRCGLC